MKQLISPRMLGNFYIFYFRLRISVWALHDQNTCLFNIFLCWRYKIYITEQSILRARVGPVLILNRIMLISDSAGHWSQDNCLLISSNVPETRISLVVKVCPEEI